MKGITRSCKSQKDRQDNDQKEKEQKERSDLQNTSLKTKDRETRIPLKTGVELRCSWAVPAPLMTLVNLLLDDTNII